jgi:hypothetical protein
MQVSLLEFLMAKRIEESALEFWSNPKAADEFLKEHNDLVDAHNNLCHSHDALVEEFKELSSLVDAIWEAVFQTTQEFDS